MLYYPRYSQQTAAMWSLATSTAAATCLNCDLEPAIQPAVRVKSNHRHSSAGQSSHVKHCGEVEQLVYHTELLPLCWTTGLPHNLCVEQLVYHTTFVLNSWITTLSVYLCVEQLVYHTTFVLNSWFITLSVYLCVEQLVYHTELLPLCWTAGLPHNLWVEQLVYHTERLPLCWTAGLPHNLCVEQLVYHSERPPLCWSAGLSHWASAFVLNSWLPTRRLSKFRWHMPTYRPVLLTCRRKTRQKRQANFDNDHQLRRSSSDRSIDAARCCAEAPVADIDR